MKENYAQDANPESQDQTISAEQFIERIQRTENEEEDVELTLRGLKIMGEVRIAGMQKCHPSINLENCCFENDFIVDNHLISFRLNISSCEFKNKFELINCKSLELPTFQGKFKQALIKECEFTTPSKSLFGYFGSLKLESSMFRALFIGDTTIEVFSFAGSFSGHMNIDEGFVRRMNFNYTTIQRDSEINIKNLTVTTLTFNTFTNHGIINIQTLKSKYPVVNIYDEEVNSNYQNLKSELLLYYSSLGFITFLNLDFDSFDKIIVEKCKLANINIYGNPFPFKGIKLFTGRYEDERNPQLLYELYSQLYLIMQKQGHRVNEMNYYAEYMNWHLKDLLKKRKDWASLLTLGFNKVSTNYGKSWIQGFLVTLLVGFIFYYLYLINLPSVKFSFDFSSKDFTYFLGEYITFMNPAHQLNFLNELNPNWLSYIIDAFGRIFVGAMIYQTISAFRRFGIR